MAVDPQEIIRQRALDRAFDPFAALAVAHVESGAGRSVYGDVDDPHDGIDPRSVQGPDGRWYTSLGPFQERVVGGAGETHLRRGGTLADLFDPATATDRFIERYRAAESFLGFGATPGQVAAEAQRPFDRTGYARKVDDTYQQLARTGGSAAPAASECPPGYYKNVFGQCVKGTGGFVPDDTTGDLPTRPGAGESFTGGGGPFQAIADAIDNLGRGLEGSVEGVRQGASQALIATAVVGVAAVLGYQGLKRILD